jgi:hypothetical protein
MAETSSPPRLTAALTVCFGLAILASLRAKPWNIVYRLHLPVTPRLGQERAEDRGISESTATGRHTTTPKMEDLCEMKTSKSAGRLPSH